jgi:glyoxylase-like metal-dependent hydrolase (beta-lactamase superfamily II)
MLWESLGVGSHLIVGGEKALLIDTGYGFGDIAAAVSRITEKPVIVVNSHVHPDHAMGNAQFRRVLVGAGDVGKMSDGALAEEYEKMLGFAKKYLPPVGLLIKHYEKTEKTVFDQTEYVPLATGDRIELGGRTIEVVEMPGHIAGSVVFLDKASKTMFVGDAVNRGMFLYLNEAVRLAHYADKLERLAAIEGYEILRSSHTKKAVPFAFIEYYARFLRRVDPGKSKLSRAPLVDGKILRYSEKNNAYGKVSVFFRQGQEASGYDA